MLLPKEKKYVVNTRNRLISDGIQMSLNTRETDRNNNILVIGGSGAGKTFRFVKPQLLQLSTSYVCTDPKGELMRDTNVFMQKNGYDVKCLNLLNEDGMKRSTRYNPFKYIQNDTDILKLVNTFMENTKEKDAQSGDQFWTDMAGLRLQSFFMYVRDFGVDVDGSGVRQKNMKAVMYLVNKDGVEEVRGQRKPSELDVIFEKVKKDYGEDYPCYVAYNNSNGGAADTVRSIISTLRSRCARLNTPEILDLLSDDEMEIASFGEKKTCLYCVIPDNDTTYNFLIGILYCQMFQQLYYSADFIHGGRLPIHVTFLLDEFYNVALPDDFLSLLSTMRSREISSVIIVQDLSQLKGMYKDGQHESILANCDTWVYLGGNGPSTQKELSEMMGKMTIDKKTTGETISRQGSSSKNFDVVGRELMFPDELRKLNGKLCVIFFRGFDVCLDKKINSLAHPLWDQMCSGSGVNFDARLYRLTHNKNSTMLDYSLLTQYEYEDEYENGKYNDEKEVAKRAGEDMPDKPKNKVINVSFNELGKLSELMDSVPDTEYFQFDEKLIERNRERKLEKMQKREAELIKKADEVAKKDKQMQMIYQNPDVAILYGKLKSQGFSFDAISLILDVYNKTKKSQEEILATFSPEMDEELIKVVHDALI